LLAGTAVVITKSTVPVGTGDEIENILREQRPEADIQVVSNPEFLREGAAIRDFKHPDRIVVGTEDERARGVLAEIYRPLYLNAPPIIYVSRRTAELIKYASNAFLATKITFINEIADLCEQVDADVQEVARGMGLDNRIGGKFLHPGPGFGGSCFPKDTSALIKTAHDHGVPLRLVETVSAVNEQRKRAMARKVVVALGGSVRGKTIAVLGLTFKPNTDDTRDSPAIPLITALHDLGATVRGYDPAGMEQAKPLLPDVQYCQSAYTAAEGADALVIATEWEQFRALDLARLKAVMAQPVIVDLRNIYRSDEMRRAAFRYVPIGRAGVE
jgi:UDPglucose 6-dehydrogenase